MSQQPPLRVMIVDDSKTIRKSGEDILTKAGCEVCLAEDGFDCLAKIRDFAPNFFFIDVMMPRLDGYQLIHIVRTHEDMRNVPVVMLTSKTGIFDKAKGMTAGASDYLTKPFERPDLIEAIQKLIPGFVPAA